MRNYKVMIISLVVLSFGTKPLFAGDNTDSKSWELGFSQENVSVLYNLEGLELKSILKLRFSNYNNYGLEISWDEIGAFAYNNVFQILDKEEQLFTVNPDETKTYALKVVKPQNNDSININNILHLGFKDVKIKKIFNQTYATGVAKTTN